MVNKLKESKDLVVAAAEEIIKNYSQEIKNCTEKISTSNNPVEMWDLLVDIFHNSSPQGKIGMKILKSYYDEDFLLNNTFYSANYSGVESKEEGIKIGFSTSRNREILIKIKSLFYNYGLCSSSYRMKQNNNIQLKKYNLFLNAPTFDNFKAISNSKRNISLIKFLFNKKQIIRECQKEKEEIVKDIKKYSEQILDIIPKVKSDFEFIKNLLKFIDTSEVIKDFVEYGYRVYIMVNDEPIDKEDIEDEYIHNKQVLEEIISTLDFDNIAKNLPIVEIGEDKRGEIK